MSLTTKKEKLINHYKKCLSQMISDLDFKRWLENPKIYKYSELNNIQNIDEILPEEKDFCIILTENEQNVGHWCCLLKYNGILEWNDSYGEKPDGELKFIPKMTKLLLGESKKPLTRLLKGSGKKIIYNKEKFQSLKEGINTCGKWSIVRIIFFNCGYTLKDFQDKIKEKVNETGKPPDILICDWIE